MALPSNGVSASPFVGLPVDGGLTAPEHADALHEYWMGGRCGDAEEFHTLGDMVMVAITGVKRFEFGVHN